MLVKQDFKTSINQFSLLQARVVMLSLIKLPSSLTSLLNDAFLSRSLTSLIFLSFFLGTDPPFSCVVILFRSLQLAWISFQALLDLAIGRFVTSFFKAPRVEKEVSACLYSSQTLQSGFLHPTGFLNEKSSASMSGVGSFPEIEICFQLTLCF